MDIKEQEWLEIFLWYICNIKCSFCYQKDLRRRFSKNIEKIEVERLLKEGIEKEKKFVIFSGGEPTLDKNLWFYIGLAKDLGYEHIRVHTNGWWFRDFWYLKDLYKKWLTWVTLSVHWYGKIQDLISWVKWNFNYILQSLINFEKIKREDRNFIIDTNTVICKLNYKNIPTLVKFLRYFSITRWQIVLAYSLWLFSNFEKTKIVPTYEEIIPFLKESINIAQENKKKFVLENIPYCVVEKDYWFAISENIKIQKESILVDKWNVWNTNTNWMQNSKKCEKCSMSSKCRWLPIDYFKVHWDNILKTIYD